jgi:hypothetical protein
MMADVSQVAQCLPSDDRGAFEEYAGAVRAFFESEVLPRLAAAAGAEAGAGELRVQKEVFIANRPNVEGRAVAVAAQVLHVDQEPGCRKGTCVVITPCVPDTGVYVATRDAPGILKAVCRVHDRPSSCGVLAR